MDDEELDANENEDNLEETEESTEEQQQGPNPEKAKDEVKKNIDRAKKTKEAMQKAQKAKKTAETAKKVKAAAKFASGAKKFALLANPYFWIALLIILAIIVLIGLIMSFTIMPSNFLGKCKKFVEEMMQGFCGFIWGDSTSPISNSSDDVKDLANYIQNMGYDIQGYGFGDVEYTNDTEKQRKEVQETNEAANAIDGKKNFVTEEQATQGGEIKKVYGLTAVTTVSSDQYKDGSEMFRITGRFSSKNNDYLRAYLSADAATYTEATYSIKGFFNELGSSIIKGLSDIFGGHSSDDWKDPGDVGVKSKSTGMLNFTNAGGNNIFNSTLGGSPTKIKVDPKNKKLILYEHSLSIFGISKIQWGQTFSVDLSNWTAIYGRPLELFLALHLSSMMPDLPYQMAVDQAFNTKVNINLEDVKIYFDTTITIDGHKFPIGNAAESLSSGSSQQHHSHHTSSDMNRTDSSEYQIVDAEYVGDEKYFHSTMGGRDGYYVGKNLIYNGVTYEIWADAGSMCTRYAFAFLASAYSCNDLNYSQIVGTKDGSTNTKYNVPTGVFEKVWKNYANIEGNYYTSGADVKDVNTIVSNMSNALSNGLPVYLYSGYRSSQGFHAVNILGVLSTGKLLMYCPYAGGVFEYGSSGNFRDNLRDLVSNADGYAVSSKYGRYVIGYFIPNSAPDGTTPTLSGGTSSSIDTSKLMFIGDSWIYGTGYSYKIIPGQSYGVSPSNSNLVTGEYYYGWSGAGTWTFKDSNIQSYDNASAIVICLGLNCTASSEKSATDNASDMKRVIDLVKAKNPDKTIYITQTPHVGRNTGDTKDPVAWNRNIDAYNSVVKSLCDGTTVVFINPNDAITDSEGFLRDDYSGGGYHLSSDGYKAWYNKIIECINNGPVGENDDIDNLEEVLRYLSGENDPIKQRNYDEIRSAVIRDGSATLTLTDENGVEVTVTMSAEDLKAIRKLVNSGSNGASIKWPNIESVTNHWYYHIIDFYGTVDKNTPYGAYKKAKIAKKTINYKDEEGELDKYNIELTALLTSQNGIYYQVCEPYLNQRPSVYLRKIFHGVYYKYDGTTETARKISAARAIEAKYGTDNYNSDKFEKDPQKIVDKNITYNWHSTDSDSSKLTVTLEDATEYVNAKKAQVKIQKESDALISIDNQEIEGADGVSASAEEFLNAAQEVTTYVKQNNFHYGDAHHMPPMANGATNSDGSKYISCDRLVAWALYKIGFTDQPQNGLVVSQLYDYCTNKGWEKITNSSEVQAGDIVLTGSSETDLVHTFICAGQNKRYDCGSDERIRLEGKYSGYTSQPFDEPISSNFVCAFRITGEVEPEETIDMSPEEAQQIIDKMGEDDGELEVNELGEESPMCKKLVDFKSNKSNSLEAFSLLENINSEAADVNYRLLKKLMIEMDYYSEDDMNSHEKNILLWITNVEGVKGQDVADKIKANLGQTSETVYKTLSDTGRDANEYGIQISNFMDNTTVVCPGDAKVKSTGEDEHGEFIELELLTLSDEKQYPENGHMMLLHQDDEKNKYYNIETKYEDDPIYSAIDVLKRYRFRDTYQVFEADDVVGITMKISGLHNVKFHEGDSVLRGEIIADNPKNGVDEEDGKDGQKGDIIYVSMKKPDKTKIENVEDYIDPTYTYEDEKDMAEQLWYLDHPEYGNKYKTTSNKKVSDYEDGTDIIKGANNEETIWFTLIGIYGYSPEGAAAIMGNWYCESGFEPNNAQNTYNSSSGLSDEQITAMIDSGEISKDSFVNTAYGYGLAQWTYWSRKEAMYDYMKGKGLSIADLGGQIGFANTEMKNLNCYGELTSKDKSRDDIYHLTEVYHDEYERSAGRNIDARAQAALEIYDRNKDKQIPEHRGGYSGSSDIEYVQWAIDNMANDDHVGYNTPNPNDWKYSDTGSWDVDCSSMVYYALKETRYSEWGGTCEMGTANEPDMLSAKGFVQHEFHSIDELEPGDILWTRGTGRDGQYHHHTEIYVADGKNVGAHSNYDGNYGDSSGKEVNVQSCATYWRYYFREGR